MKKLLILFFALFSPLYSNVFFTDAMMESHVQGYDEEEKMAILKDLKVIRDLTFNEIKYKKVKATYLATAGAPGARKSTILERFIKEHSEYVQPIYLDPDQRGLKFMVNTYYSRSLSALVLAEDDDIDFSKKKAYEKWRGASNYITLNLLEEAFAQGSDIAHGTTSTGNHVPQFFENIKMQGYEITLLLCSCEDSFREEALRYRIEEQKFYQSSPTDAIPKGKLFPQRMADYFKHGDNLFFYWSDSLKEKERLAAIIISGRLTIYDEDAWEKFISKYERDRQALRGEGIELASFNELLRGLDSDECFD